MRTTVYISLTLLVLAGCGNHKWPYDLNFPDQSIPLSNKLNEISGLELLSDSVVIAVQDEKALVYYLDLRSGDIIDHFDFGKNADYEGIAASNNEYYVLRSDGTIFKVSPTSDTEQFKFKHSKDFDFEGLCLDKSNNRLLVACKEHGDKDKKDHIFIYSFLLDSNTYDKKPAFKIPRDKVHKNFKPSAIAIHPNGNIYILSSFSKTLLVISAKGTILRAEQLNAYIFHQPEGITFNAAGDLYLSNERTETAATILKFKNTHKRK
ncbi:MAG: hypothetical protein ACI9JN_001337 [Bacteroidia bacterium]|jgi:uncharacterized protein YjiK